MNCKTVEELPDFKGHPEDDQILIAATARHESAGVRHTGQLFRIDEATWGLRETREQVIKQIQESLDPNAETGLGSATYAMVDNFKADAMACWEKHLRNPACSDYKSDSKRLVPDTAAERKEM